VAGWPRMVVGRLAHVAIPFLLCPKGVVVELKRGIVEGNGRTEGEGGRSVRPAGQGWWPGG
jgi:hypothetical protein